MPSPGSAQESAPTSRRSKITPERAQELYTAVLDLLRESGYESLTMEGVASRTRCGKSTLYRQWGSKPELVVAALHGTRQDAVLGHRHRQPRGRPARGGAGGGRAVRPGHRADARAQPRGLQNPDLLRALRSTLIDPGAAAIDAMVRRAVRRGEIAADNPAAEYVAAQVLGIMRARPLLEGATRTRSS